MEALKLRYFVNDTKCRICGKSVTHHNAITGGCPIGRRDRTGGYSFSSKDFFTPKLPRIPKKIREALDQYVAVSQQANVASQEGNTTLSSGEWTARVGAAEYELLERILELK